jgi:HEAT repeat protein
MRHLLLAGLFLTASAALAQGASGASAPAPTPALAESAPAAVVSPGGPDVALLRGILWASEPAPDEVRAIAIEDLALLGDPRALGPLSALMWDPNPRIQSAAVRAVALFQHPRAEDILTSVVRSTRLPDALKIQALDGLLYQRTPSARATLESASRDPHLPLAVQSAALNVAARWGGAR